MQKTQSIAKLITSAMVLVAIAAIDGPMAQAERRPRPVFLFDTQCVKGISGRWRKETANVSVDRRVYRSFLSLGPGTRFASLTCRIRRDDGRTNFQSLQLEFGMRDNDRGSPSIDVSIYLDGEEQGPSYTLRPGQIVSTSLNVTNVSNVAIETQCSSSDRYCDRVYFFEATLDPVPLPPKDSPSAAPPAVSPEPPPPPPPESRT